MISGQTPRVCREVRPFPVFRIMLFTPRLAHGAAAKSPQACHLFDARQHTIILVRVAGGGTIMVVAELQTKVEKYETRASRCEAQAREAKDKAQQTFYEVLAGYYASLA